MYVCNKEDICITLKKLNEIVENSDNKVNNALWLLEMYRYGIKYDKSWEYVIDNIVEMITNKDIMNNKKLYSTLKKIREQYYILFITNIPTQIIIRKIMSQLLCRIKDIKLKYNVIDITSIFEQRLSQGTRHIIHIEAYIARLIYLFTVNKPNNLDILEI
jgi:replication factor C subunit 3/5